MREHGNGLMLDIGARHQEPQTIVDNLRELQQQQQDYSTTLPATTNDNNVVFLIWPDAPISQVVDVLVETIQICSKRNLKFHRLIFHHYNWADESHLAVLQAACTHPLFQMLVISSNVDDPADTRTLYALKDAMVTNKELKQIKMHGLELGEAGFGIMGDGLKETESLESLSMGFWPQAHDAQNITLPPKFLQGLKNNRSLKSLCLDSFPMSMEPCLKALLDHPTIKSLSITRSCWTESSIVALGALLSSPQCGITGLNLMEPTLDTRPVFAQNLGDALRQNQTVTWIGLARAGLDDATLAKLWLDIATMKQLVGIDLAINRVQSLQFLTATKMSTKVVPRLKWLEIRDNPIIKLEPNEAETTGGILDCLYAHPNLCSLGSDFAKSSSCSPKIRHLLDLNGNGRSLVFGNHHDHDDDTTTTTTMVALISVWPKVLERGNKKLNDNRIRQASVLYDLVRSISASL